MIGHINYDIPAGLSSTTENGLGPNPESRGTGDGMKEPSPAGSETNWFSGVRD